MHRLLSFMVLLLCAIPGSAHAGEPLFGYVYTTDTLPEGKWELEQWVTDREGQAHGHYHHFDMRTEAEFGITDKFQLAAYLNYMYLSASGNSVAGLTEGIEIPWDHDSSQPYNAFRFDGLSIEAIYRILSPYLDPVGLALYLEPELGTWESGLEFRVILQKNFLDDQLVLGLNVWTEIEREKNSNLVVPGSDDVPTDGASTNTMAEIDLGASYRFAPGWSFGLEFRNHNEFQGISLSHADQDHTAFFFGPNIHYGAEHWFFTLSVLHQLWAIAYNEDQKAAVYNGLIYGDEHTAWDGIRLKVGFPF